VLNVSHSSSNKYFRRNTSIAGPKLNGQTELASDTTSVPLSCTTFLMFQGLAFTTLRPCQYFALMVSSPHLLTAAHNILPRQVIATVDRAGKDRCAMVDAYRGRL